MKLKVVVGGNLEFIFGGERKVEVELSNEGPKMKDLIEELRENHLDGDEILFYDQGTVRAGINVLINDKDWEL